MWRDRIFKGLKNWKFEQKIASLGTALTRQSVCVVSEFDSGIFFLMANIWELQKINLIDFRPALHLSRSEINKSKIVFFCRFPDVYNFKKHHTTKLRCHTNSNLNLLSRSITQTQATTTSTHPLYTTFNCHAQPCLERSLSFRQVDARSHRLFTLRRCW